MTKPHLTAIESRMLLCRVLLNLGTRCTVSGHFLAQERLNRVFGVLHYIERGFTRIRNRQYRRSLDACAVRH